MIMAVALAGMIAASPVGADETYTGRRWYVHVPGGTCFFWGYLKKPGQKWSAARLVILDERVGIAPPDRTAAPGRMPAMGEDHNFEYTVRGSFTGRTAYDPNSDLVLPTFAARKFVLTNRNPGPLPTVGRSGANKVVPGREAGRQNRNRLR
jgi:hypothetical protein